MQRASAVPTGARRVSIQADTIGLDVVLSAALPVALLLPRIVDALARHGDFDAGQTAVRWQLTAPGETVLDASKTLDELEIRDGTTLALSRSSMTFSAPRCDDEAEAISEAVTLVQRRWTRRTALIVGALIANCWAGVSAAGLLRVAFDAGGERRTGCVGIALAISLLALLAAAVVYRLYRERGAGLALGLLATGFAALAGLCAVSGGPGAPNAVFAAAAATTSSAIMRVIACHAVVFTTLTCITTTCGIATAVWMVTGAPLPAIGAALAAISLALLEAAPPISVMLARLSTHRTPETPLTKPDQLDARAIRAHTWLTSLAAAFCASAALGALGAAAGPSLRGIMLAVVTGSLLLSRARTHQDIGRAVPHLVGGSVTLGGVLVASAAAYPHLALYVASLSMAFGFLALYLGFAGRMKVVSPAGRRITELVEYFAFATVVPLAVWLCGIYAAARSVNLP